MTQITSNVVSAPSLLMKRPIGLLASTLAFLVSSIALAATPRNVVFILADDLGWGELGSYGQKKINTPNLDLLAKEGMRFTQHYSGAPVCAPSRNVLMTGKHLGHTEIRGNLQAKVHFPQFNEGQHPIAASTQTLAMHFQAAGYATGAMGKWGLGPVGSTGDPNKKGFDLFFGYNCQAVAHSFYPKFLWRNDQQVQINAKAIPGHAKKPTGEVTIAEYTGETYASTPILQEALGFIEKNKGQKFFLYLPLTEPHVAMHPPQASVDEYPIEWDDEPYRGQSGYLPHPRPRAGYAALISDLDRHVGAVVKKLRDAGILDDTLIVFTSDNGTTHMAADPKFGIGGVDAAFFNSTAGLRGFKGSVFEGGLRVPMIVRYPAAVKAGSVSDVVGYFADWFPTLCAACDLKTPEKLDGINLWPAITGEGKAAERNPLLWVYPEYGGQVAVRIGDKKVLRRNLKTKRPEPWEVYDVVKDPSEKNNLAASEQALIEQAVSILQKETDENALFPLEIPAAKD